MGVGREKEPYEAIARGPLNIAGLPVLRDERGAFGSPTSDSTRTMARNETNRILLLFFNFGGHEGLHTVLEEAAGLIGKHCQGQKIDISP